jgi:hypothetical protein
MKKTIAECLKDLKVLDARITSGINRIISIGIKQGNKLPTGFATAEEFNTAVIGSITSAEKLIKNRAAIKSAIVTSNAVTKVTIGDVAMTVAEAIEMKSSIGYQQSLMSQLEHQFAAAKTAVDSGNRDVNNRLDQMLIASRGKEGKVDVEADKAFTDNFLNNNLLTLLDPAGLRDRIEKIRTGIEDFAANVDVKLSISNAITEIEVE